MHWRACFFKAKLRTKTVPGRERGHFRDLSLESTVSRKIGMHGVVGDRMVGSWSDMNQGSRSGEERRSWLLRSGNHWVVDADLKSYFDTIPHERLMERVGEKIADSRVLSLIEGMLQAGVMDSIKGWQATKQGSPQGAVISPLLSNIYLNGLDCKMAQNGFEMVRYADDCVPRARRVERTQQCATAQPMRGGPSEPACRSRFQTAFGGYEQKAWS